MKRRAVAIGILLGGVGRVTVTWACGVCVEDKMAATYDHAVAVSAKKKSFVVVFCDLSKPLTARQLSTALAHQRSIDLASLRVAANPAAASFAMDPRKGTPRAVIAEIQKQLPKGTQISLLRVQSSD
jgi:hypothetical protein